MRLHDRTCIYYFFKVTEKRNMLKKNGKHDAFDTERKK